MTIEQAFNDALQRESEALSRRLQDYAIEKGRPLTIQEAIEMCRSTVLDPLEQDGPDEGEW